MCTFTEILDHNRLLDAISYSAAFSIVFIVSSLYIAYFQEVGSIKTAKSILKKYIICYNVIVSIVPSYSCILSVSEIKQS